MDELTLRPERVSRRVRTPSDVPGGILAQGVYVYDASLAEMATTALALAEHRPDAVAVVAVDGVDSTGVSTGVEPITALLAAGSRREPYSGATTWDETIRLYTSGTTGMPKGVSLPSLAEVFTAHDVIMHFPLDPQDRTMNMTPWFHRGGISPGGPNAAFYVGAAVVTMRSFDAQRCLDMVAEHELTFIIGAPTNLAMLTAAQEERPRDLSTLRGIVTMGAPLERSACLRYQRVLTPRIFNGYGTTEAFWNTFLRPGTCPSTPAAPVGPAPTTTWRWYASTTTASRTRPTRLPRTVRRSAR